MEKIKVQYIGKHPVIAWCQKSGFKGKIQPNDIILLVPSEADELGSNFVRVDEDVTKEAPKKNSSRFGGVAK
jgi:hypothetical protein